jgi:hypothetical protein
MLEERATDTYPEPLPEANVVLPGRLSTIWLIPPAGPRHWRLAGLEKL